MNARHVFLDLDGGGKEAVDRVLHAEGMPNPHHVLNTSADKHQIIWSVDGFEKDQAENLVRTMVKDVHQTLATERAYRPADFSAVSELKRKRQPAFGALKPQATEGGFSQSQRDWAYVMRELKHGVDPDSLQSQLEQSRQDKPNPQYYAQRTVARATVRSKKSRLTCRRESLLMNSPCKCSKAPLV